MIGRVIFIGVFVMLMLVLGGCFPGFGESKRAAVDLERFRYEARLSDVRDGMPATPHLVSAIRGGVRDAPRIIYVHGTPGEATGFARYIADPIDGFESIAIDRPGFGRTLPRGSVPSFAEQAAAIEPLLVERDGVRPILVGHSLGGPIVAKAAALYPDRVGGIVILAGSLDPSLEEPKWFNYAGQFSLVRAVMGRVLRTSNDEIMAAEEQTERLRELLTSVRVPVSILHGDTDTLVPVGNVDYMRAEFGHLDDVSVRIIKGEGHFLPWRQEAEVRAAIEGLSARVRASDPGS